MRALLAAALVLACQTATTRPTFGPVHGAPRAELALEVPDATRILAEALEADSVPVRRVEPRDGMVESAWFEMPGFAVTGRRPLGPAVTMVRAWVDVDKAGHSLVTIETVYRIAADPSRAYRELEAQVPETHPAAVKVREVLRKVVAAHGDTASVPVDTLAVERARRRDTTPVVRPDSMSRRP